jgi:hypothetical protein
LAEHIRQFAVEHPDGLVFTDEDGHALRRTTFSREIWRPAVKKAGAPKGIGMHELRHYYASLLIRHGESVKTSNADSGTPRRRRPSTPNSHLWPDSDDRTRDAIDAVLGLGVPRRAPTSSQDDIHAGHRLEADELACKPDPVHRTPYGVPAGGHPSRPAVAGRL